MSDRGEAGIIVVGVRRVGNSCHQKAQVRCDQLHSSIGSIVLKAQVSDMGIVGLELHVTRSFPGRFGLGQSSVFLSQELHMFMLPFLLRNNR